MAEMSASERCQATPELVNMIISFLDNNDQLNCLCVNTMWHNLALANVLKHISDCPHDNILRRQKVLTLLAQPLVRSALVRNSGHIRSLEFGRFSILNLLVEAPNCTRLVSLRCYLGIFSLRMLNMLAPFICQNPHLISVHFESIPGTIDLQELGRALQTCRGLSSLHLQMASNVSYTLLGSLIRDLARPHLWLKDLDLNLPVGDTPAEGWALFERDQRDFAPLFPRLEELRFNDDSGRSYVLAENFYLPVLNEAAALKTLYIPDMPYEDCEAAVESIARQRPPLERLYFETGTSHPGFVDIVKNSRKTLRVLEAHELDPTVCASMLQSFVQVNESDLCYQMNLREITFVLAESPTASALMQKVLISLPNLECFTQETVGMYPDWIPGRLEIRDMVATSWVCHGLIKLSLCLGCHTAENNVEETEQERRTKIGQVYKQLGVLTQLEHLTLRCNVLDWPSKVEFDFTIESGLKAMEPCLTNLQALDIQGVAGSRFSTKEKKWMREHTPQAALSYTPYENHDDEI
ncbi:hypothetical protein BG006_004919 [Podila minutissima]|uniref:F-box domain-containing protein n=1 Tax=Podila minutissima TaxID=64525 RepID=A0A9P5VMD8_9FUNG|nr:hypothetical protein BG006_004919 [Podila minutissima]